MATSFTPVRYIVAETATGRVAQLIVYCARNAEDVDTRYFFSRLASDEELMAHITAIRPDENGAYAGSFASIYPYYVERIKLLTAENWYPEQLSGVPPGAVVYVSFIIDSNGIPQMIGVYRESGYPALDNSCIRAVQHVRSYGPLPSSYTSTSVMFNGRPAIRITYYCEMPL